MQNHQNAGSETSGSVSPTTGAGHADCLENAETLTQELKRLLVNHEDTLNDEGMRRDVETLEHWMESYRQGMKAARKLSASGTSILADMREHLKLAIDERHRLEGEGGNPPSKEQDDKIEELVSAMQRIEAVLPTVEEAFPVTKTEHSAENA